MENAVKERLLEFIDKAEPSINQFEIKIGMSSGFVNNIGKSITGTSLVKIFEKYPELNIGWLLTGRGEMLINIIPLVIDVVQINTQVIKLTHIVKSLVQVVSDLPENQDWTKDDILRELNQKIPKNLRDVLQEFAN